ncbi:MAG: zinc-binding dehydrogenase [Oscillospiraceae bacterium]|nr:zinc-binding dehydrogenase [Oscillospiraceae bacterium]
MPREIVATAPDKVGIAEYQEKELAAGQVRIKVDYAAPKHGTELHCWLGDADAVPSYYDIESKCFIEIKPDPNAPKGVNVFRPGNMWVGHITEVAADVTDYKVGDRVAGYGCLRETQVAYAHRENEPGFGGCYDLLKMSEEMSWKAALCYDPCQFALSGVRDSMLRLGDVCLISGLGAIGLMAAQMAKLQGAKTVIVSDPIAKRREIALANGADIALDPMTQDVGLEVKNLTNKKGADVVIETSGTYSGLQAALRGVTYGGRIAVVGWYKKCRGNFDLGLEAHMNNATIFFSRACSEPNPDYPRWNWDRINEECWHLLSTGALKCDNVIDPVVSFEDAGNTYLDVVAQNPSKSVKMGVEF